jgi:hypothetical protein
MPFESFKTSQGSERPGTPEQREREMKSKMFKGLLAVGAGALWAEWNAFSVPNKKNVKLIEEEGFFGAAAQKARDAYSKLEKVEKFLDPKGEIRLIDLFEKYFLEKKEEQAQGGSGEKKDAT